MTAINPNILQQSLTDEIAKLREQAATTVTPVADKARAFLIAPLAGLPRGTHTESGGVVYSSLTYCSADDAEAAFAAHNPHVYARNGHPAASALVDVLCCFDPGAVEGYAVGHGMAAVTAVTDALIVNGVLTSGDRVVASRFLFGTCRRVIEQLPLLGIEVVLIDGRDLNAWREAVNADTKLVFFETPGNPTLELVDIAAVEKLVHEASDALVVVDNSLEFPAQTPLALGADIVVTSLTKILGPDPATGGGADSGGTVLFSAMGLVRLHRITRTDDNIICDHIQRRGATIAARVAIEMLKRAPLLEARFVRQSAAAYHLASHIAAHYPDITVLSPHLTSHPQYALAQRQMKGSVVFTIDLGTRERAFTFIDALIDEGATYVNNFYSYRTTVTHPASTTHHSLSVEEQRAQGLSPGHVRVSAGVEDIALLTRLFDAALAALSATGDTHRIDDARLLLAQ